MENSTLRAACYSRVSTDEQETDGQQAELRRYAEAFGWSAVNYVDQGASGHDKNRPALDRLIRDAANGRINVVLIWRLDRLGRSLRNIVNTVTALRDAGIRVIALDGFDTASDFSPIMLGILAGLAEMESKQISARVKLNIRARRERGEHVGRKPVDVPAFKVKETEGLSLRDAADVLGVKRSTLYLARHPEKRRSYGERRISKPKPRPSTVSLIDLLPAEKRSAAL